MSYSNGRKSKEKKKTQKHLTYRGIKIRILLDITSKDIQARREWRKIKCQIEFGI